MITKYFDEGELDKKVVVANYATTTHHGTPRCAESFWAKFVIKTASGSFWAKAFRRWGCLWTEFEPSSESIFFV